MSISGSIVGSGSWATLASTPLAAIAAVPKLKIPFPDTFNGTRSQLKPFLSQLKTYMLFNTKLYINKTYRVLWASTLLKGRAFDWIETFITDYQNNLATKTPNDTE